MTTKFPDADSITSARRRLIKGGFAVPVALTVASGSALARTSSGCVARDASAKENPSFDANNTTWHRVLAYTYQKNNGSDRTYWIRYTEINALAVAANVAIKNLWLASGQALCVQGGPMPTGGNNYIAKTVYSSLPPLTASNTAGTGLTRYYAVLFDTAGDIVGISENYGGTASPGGAVHQSCWNSFALSK